MFSRRTFFGVATLPLLAGSSAASPNSEKTQFMKTAIAAIRQSHGLDSSANNIAEDAMFTTICVPYPFADFDYYYTKGPLNWIPNDGQQLVPVAVPEGFFTDLTSVPQIFWSTLPKTGRYAYAAIAHDFLYWVQTTTRDVADSILYEAMKDSQVSNTTSWTIYQAVKNAGGSAWTSNTRAKAAGERRFLKTFPDATRLISWADWKSDSSRFSD
jgi:hypothetical protein